MKLTLTNQESICKFATLLQNLKVFSEHIVFHFSVDGIYMQGMDSSHCSCFEIKLTSKWFDSFTFNENDDPSSMGVSTNVLQKIFGTRKDGQVVEMNVSNESEHLELSFTGEEKVLDKFFEIPLMEIEEDLLHLGSSDSEVDLIIPSKKFCELVSQLQMFHDTLSLEFTETNVTFLSSGIDGSMKVNVSFEDVVEYAVSEGINLQQCYSTKFISMMCSFSKLNEELIMAFSNDRPLEGKYKLGEESYAAFYLAPKIENDD